MARGFTTVNPTRALTGSHLHTRHAQGHFHLVFLTDGADTSSKNTFEECAKTLLLLGAVGVEYSTLWLGVKLNYEAEAVITLTHIDTYKTNLTAVLRSEPTIQQHYDDRLYASWMQWAAQIVNISMPLRWKRSGLGRG